MISKPSNPFNSANRRLRVFNALPATKQAELLKVQPAEHGDVQQAEQVEAPQALQDHASVQVPSRGDNFSELPLESQKSVLREAVGGTPDEYTTIASSLTSIGTFVGSITFAAVLAALFSIGPETTSNGQSALNISCPISFSLSDHAATDRITKETASELLLVFSELFAALSTNNFTSSAILLAPVALTPDPTTNATVAGTNLKETANKALRVLTWSSVLFLCGVLVGLTMQVGLSLSVVRTGLPEGKNRTAHRETMVDVQVYLRHHAHDQPLNERTRCVCLIFISLIGLFLGAGILLLFSSLIVFSRSSVIEGASHDLSISIQSAGAFGIAWVVFCAGVILLILSLFA